MIDWFEIPVREMGPAQTFYEAVLQATLHKADFAGPGMQMAVFSGAGDAVKGALISGHPAMQVGVCGSLVYLHAGVSLDDALKRLLAEGCQALATEISDGLDHHLGEEAQSFQCPLF